MYYKYFIGTKLKNNNNNKIYIQGDFCNIEHSLFQNVYFFLKFLDTCLSIIINNCRIFYFFHPYF